MLEHGHGDERAGQKDRDKDGQELLASQRSQPGGDALATHEPGGEQTGAQQILPERAQGRGAVIERPGGQGAQRIPERIDMAGEAQVEEVTQEHQHQGPPGRASPRAMSV